MINTFGRGLGAGLRFCGGAGSAAGGLVLVLLRPMPPAIGAAVGREGPLDDASSVVIVSRPTVPPSSLGLGPGLGLGPELGLGLGGGCIGGGCIGGGVDLIGVHVRNATGTLGGQPGQ